MTEIKRGDRVKVALEGEVTWTAEHTNAFGLKTQDGREVALGTVVARYAEVLPPPVVTFKPGDLVRKRGRRDLLYSLGGSGYLSHSSGLFFNYSDSFQQPEHWTSDVYERVEV